MTIPEGLLAYINSQPLIPMLSWSRLLACQGLKALSELASLLVVPLELLLELQTLLKARCFSELICLKDKLDICLVELDVHSPLEILDVLEMLREVLNAGRSVLKAVVAGPVELDELVS